MARKIAIVMSGGGAKGAFQVGVLDELITRRGVTVDIFAGVSTGAIQALAGAQNDIPGLLGQWLALRGNGDVYSEKPLGIVGGFLGASSLYDPRAIRDRIRAFADEAKLRATGKTLLLGTVNLQTGLFRSIRENTPGIADWVYASAAQPPFFPPLTTRDAQGREEQWVDGGVRNVTPLSDALAQNPRAVLVIMASPLTPPAATTRQYTAIVPIALRSVSILSSEVMQNDTEQATLINDLLVARAAQARALADAGVTGTQAKAVLAPLDAQLARYRFAPIRILAPPREFSDTLEFDPAKIRAAIEAGRKAVADDWPAIQALIATP